MSRGRGVSRAGLLGSATSGTARVSVLAVLITVGFTTALFLLAGANPIDAYIRYLVTPLTSQFGLLEVAVAATPILLTGAAVAIAFRAGFWNIGAEGQLLAGAVAAAAIGPLVGDLPSWVAIPLMIAAGALAGAAWVLVPALLRVRLGIDEVVTTLLLNPVALLVVNALLHGPWRDPKRASPSRPASRTRPSFRTLSRSHGSTSGSSSRSSSCLVAWYVLTRTAAGLRLRAVGLSPHAARFAGINVERTLLSVALVSGAIAGIAGVGEVAGIQHRLTSGLSSGFGYTGIVVAMLGGLTMPGVLVAGLLLGDLTVGTSSAYRPLAYPVADGPRGPGRAAARDRGAAGGPPAACRAFGSTTRRVRAGTR